GRLDVDNFERDDESDGSPAVFRKTGSIRIGNGDLDHRLGPRELHRVANSSESSAFSLQLYAGPIETYSVFEERSGVRRLVTATCDLELPLF
ncbi:MAG TPA: hypothetical protein VMH02_07290, partial [Verrucomicrobiae bacterium]|nr:hypothetical protein [Verrucomicrobiae bacterium]